MQYRIGFGGEPDENDVIVDTIEEAEEKAMEMAEAFAESRGDDTDVAIYGGPGGEWGACPPDHDGAYYPCITVGKE